MKYQPALPEHNDNVSHQNPVKEFIILMIGVIGIGFIGYWALGLFVDVAVDYLSPEQEAELFSTVKFDWEFGKATMPEKQALLQTYIEELKPCLSLPYPITVSLVSPEDPEERDIVNAMAVPGGTIVVFSGLLDAISSKNGLMFVLAHELGHFKNRDHLRSMGRGIILVIFSMFAFGGDVGMPDVLASTINFRTATYSQSRESQADLTALHALQCHFGHVGGDTELFESLQAQSQGLDIPLSHYFSSHPELQQRIDDLHRLSQELGFSAEEPEKLAL